MISKKTLILLFAILILGFFLRHNDFKATPRLGSTFDEYAWTWLGINLINNQIPESWSPHKQYEGHRKYVIYQQTNFWVVKPYLEHPPLFGLVAGAFAKANGVSHMYELSIDKIRPLALILGIISIGMVFILAKEIYGTNIGLLSALIFSVIPTVVIGSRIVQNENFFIPLFLFSLYSTVKFIKTNNRKYLWLAIIVCGLLPLAKVPWIAASLGSALILLYKKKYRQTLILMSATAIFFSTYLAYGFHFNKDLFLGLWSLQLNRYDLTFNSVFALFTEPFMVDRYFVDGWIYFGWFAFFLLLAKDFKKNFFLILPAMTYFAVFVFAIPNEAGHGWYRYPFYPFLAISIAIFIKDHFNKNLLLSAVFILLIGLSMLEHSWTKAFGFSFVIFRGFLFLVAFSVLPLFIDNPRIKKLSSFTTYLMLGIVFILSIWSALSYSER